MKNIFPILLLFLMILGCKGQDKPDPAHVISQDDYYIEYTSDDVAVYYLSDGKLMSGHYEVKVDTVLKEKLYVKNGILEGAYKTYYPNGSIANTIFYKNGKKDGEDKFYYKTGKLKRETLYKNDEPAGKSIHYNEDGTIYLTREKINGKRRTQSYREGKVMMEEFDSTVNNKNLTITKIYDNEGNSKMIIGFEMKSGTMKDEYMYILNKDLKIIDSLNAKKDQQKLMELMLRLGISGF